MPEINAVVYTTQTIDTFNNVINALTLVVVVFIIAAALAFAVITCRTSILTNGCAKPATDQSAWLL